MKKWKIAAVLVSMLVLFIGCSDMIDVLAHIELAVEINDRSIPLDSSFTLYGTREGSSEQFTKDLGDVTEVTLIPLRPGTWTLSVEAMVEDVLRGNGTAVVTVKQGSTMPVTIGMNYRYAVTFDAGDGGTASPVGKDVVYAGPYGSLATATKTGYTLEGWYTGQEGNGTRIGEGTIFSSVSPQTLYAKWDANSYEVTLDRQEGSGGSDSVCAVYDAAMPSATVPSRTGYTFGGYYDGASGTGNQYYSAAMAGTRIWDKADAATLYAQWTPIHYAITYELNSGENDAANPSGYTIETATITLLDPARTGYTFGGWFSDSGFTAANEVSFISQGSTEDITLYAKWNANSYEVTLNRQEGSGGSDSVSAVYDAAMPSATFPSRTGYTFGGYYDGASGTGNQYYSAAMAGTRIWDKADAATLYAQWTPIHYAITYELNSGENDTDNPATYTIETATITLLDPARTGYTFGGWFSDSGFTASNGVSSISQGSTEDITLYAKWSPNTDTAYTVEHYQQDVDGTGYGTYLTDNLTGTTDTEVTALANSYTGFTENTTHTGRIPSGTVAADGSLVLKLYYDRNTYTVSFTENEGSAVSDLTGVRYRAKITAPTAPTRTGYSFGGWYKDAGLANAWAFGSDMVTAATTLYAKWNANTDTAYTVEHYQQDVDGTGYGTYLTDNLTGTTDTEVTALANSYTGFTENTTHIGRIPIGTVAADGSLVLKLYYDRNTYTVSFMENEGSTVSDLTGVRYGAKITAPTAPTRTGYSFGGWYKDGGLANAWAFGSDTVTAATTLYAKWSPNTDTAYTVEHYQQDVGGSGYTRYETEAKTGTTATFVTATAKVYLGFAENTSYASRISSGTVAADGSLVLRLYYDRNSYTVSFDSQSGSAPSPTSTSVTYGQAYGSLATTTRTGYTFDGWYTGANGTGTKVESTTTVSTATNHTLYAKWRANSYTVSFDSQSGTAPSPTSTSVTYGQAYGSLATTTRTGYTFDGWYTGANGTGTKVESTTTVSTATNHTLYAKWRANIYTVSFDSQSGTAPSPASTSVTYGQAYGSLATTTRTGYTFDGWYTGANGTGTKVESTTTVSTATNHTLYAKWLALEVGGFGPSGGYIFFDNGDYSLGWRYLEAAPSDLVLGESDYGHIFGYYRTTPQGNNLMSGATGTAIGTGKANTDALVSKMGTTAYTVADTNKTTTTGDYAAKLAYDYNLTVGGVIYDDWFLPSKDELNEMYLVLHANGLGNFYREYWSSSEGDETVAWYADFGGVWWSYGYRSNTYIRVRPVRAF